MKKILTLTAAALALAGCGNTGGKLSQAEIEEYGEIGYADIVSFIIQGYQTLWAEGGPEELELSSVYSYCSPTAGAAIQDINGDGIKELLIGDDIDGTVLLYDIYTINPKDASLIHLAKGGERDTFTINGSGVIVENGSNSAFDSFTKAYTIKNGKLKELKDQAWEEDLMKIDLDSFTNYVKRPEILGGFTDLRDPSEEEIEMLRKATSNLDVTYTPIKVATQVVAGTNYLFQCYYEGDEIELSNGQKYRKTELCWIKIFKPLPGRGEPSVTDIQKIDQII